MTTREEIRDYLKVKTMPAWDKFAGETVSHMLMVCDTFSYEDYPVYVAEGQDIQQVIKENSDETKYSRVMEVYSYKRDIEEQLREHRAWHPDVSSYSNYSI